MIFEYKKPGAWLWTRHENKSLEQDVAACVLEREWRFRVPTEVAGQFFSFVSLGRSSLNGLLHGYGRRNPL